MMSMMSTHQSPSLHHERCFRYETGRIHEAMTGVTYHGKIKDSRSVISSSAIRHAEDNQIPESESTTGGYVPNVVSAFVA